MGKELSVSVASLKAAYPDSVLLPETVAVYTTALERFDPQLVQAAVGRLILESRFLPRVAEIAEAVAEEALGLPSTAEAWNEAEGRSMGSWPYDRTPLVTQVMNLVGGQWEIQHSETPGVIRAQFRDLYAELRRDKIEGFIHDRPERPIKPEPEENPFDVVDAVPMPQLRAMP